MIKINNLLGLDIGGRRIGVARVNLIARLPEPLATLTNDSTFASKLKELIDQYQIDGLVVGLPRNLSGQETAQSEYTKNFCEDNLTQLDLPIFWQDETLSSVTAEDALQDKKHTKSDVDAMAATVILADYLSTNLKEVAQ
jgi:putative Holliday junction resolvase